MRVKNHNENWSQQQIIFYVNADQITQKSGVAALRTDQDLSNNYF
jgi:hypothetical protein